MSSKTRIALSLCVLVLIFATFKPFVEAEKADASKSGSYAHFFKYDLAFHPSSGGKEAHFTAKLTNNSGRGLLVRVNHESFHSTLEFTPAEGEKFEAFDKFYRTLMLTSIWDEPYVDLDRQESIQWHVPLSRLLTLHGEPVTHDSIEGSTVVSEMALAVVPTKGGWIADNAKQRSKPITIPSKE